MIASHLKQHRTFQVPNTGIKWDISRHRLRVTVQLDQRKCGELVLPPEEIGVCQDWRNAQSGKDSTLFTASWDLRRANFEALDTVSAKLALCCT